MGLPIVLSADTAYATKSNIVYPGTQAQATAAETRADARLDDLLASQGVDNVSATVGAGSIEIGG